MWSHPSDLNRRPFDYESNALPTELGWPVRGRNSDYTFRRKGCQGSATQLLRRVLSARRKNNSPLDTSPKTPRAEKIRSYSCPSHPSQTRVRSAGKILRDRRTLRRAPSPLPSL